jgi:cytochrome c-type biogenesis protein
LKVSIMSTAARLAIVGAVVLAYAVGHCSVLAAAGASGPRLARYAAWGECGVSVLRRVCGVLVLAGGVYLVDAAP